LSELQSRCDAEVIVTQNVSRAIISSVARIGYESGDTEEARLQKTLLVASAIMMSTGGVVWGLLLLFNGEPVVSIIPFAYTAISLVNIVVFRWIRRYQFFRFIQLLISLLLPFLLMEALGGFLNSGATVVWSLVAPLGALLFTGRRQAIIWVLAFLAVVAVSGIIEPLIRQGNNLSATLVIVFFVLNISAPSILAIVLLLYFLDQRDAALELLRREQEKSESLLLNVLPGAIAAILKNEDRTIADHHDSASILFADLAGFTPLSSEMAPAATVELLNEIFSHFDSLVEQYGVEKIRTIGDNYMVASGVPRSRRDHAHVLANFALDMLAYTKQLPIQNGNSLDFRIGMNSGPLVAGVIGRKRFHYDVWGDTVNIASRMESHGVPGRIHISKATRDILGDKFLYEPRGAVDIKGKGEMQTWFLVGRA
jgi:guanylate cyclase